MWRTKQFIIDRSISTGCFSHSQLVCVRIAEVFHCIFFRMDATLIFASFLAKRLSWSSFLSCPHCTVVTLLLGFCKRESSKNLLIYRHFIHHLRNFFAAYVTRKYLPNTCILFLFRLVRASIFQESKVQLPVRMILLYIFVSHSLEIAYSAYLCNILLQKAS